ncbi:methyltransferase domain-containing protein [Thiomicrorhabdus arctica]|uniref:methyltransferase domain-containing protein n=1 Tax=Thiomicrorhabdus arctica TaxID=131540 RepID=UPI0003727081|nr:methyltransferase domain-containing protein [Thiomicrorhabdus arctica]
MTPKIQPNTLIDSLDITGLTHDGRGVARHNGKTIFVHQAVPGDRVKAKITQSLDKFDEAEYLQILTPSNERVEPFCEYYANCGGCQLQHLSLDAQRLLKGQNFMMGLTKAVDAKQCEIAEPLVGNGEGYRRRARLGLVISKKDKIARLGFRQKASNELIDITNCPVLSPALNQSIQENRAELLDTASRAYKEITFVEADNGIFINRSTEKTGDKESSSIDRPYYQLDTQVNLTPTRLTFEFPKDGFIQVNAEMNKAMVKQAIAWLKLDSSHKVLDLFCGVGNFTLPIAQHVAQAVGIEGEQSLVNVANHNAHLNLLENVKFHKANLFNDMRPLPWFHNNQYDRILLDPGRQGAFDLCKTLGLLNAQIIVYVSCNAATLTRDIKELEKQGYRLTKAGLIDMFPHTTHTEVMVQLTKTQKSAPKIKKRPIFRL